MDSILDSIKKLLGIQPEYKSFDADIIMHINTVLVILNQINVGPPEGFLIYDGTELWEDYIDKEQISMVISYIYLRVRLLFDPPGSGILVDSINRMISELEWRLCLEGEKGGEKDE